MTGELTTRVVKSISPKATSPYGGADVRAMNATSTDILALRRSGYEEGRLSIDNLTNRTDIWPRRGSIVGRRETIDAERIG